LSWRKSEAIREPNLEDRGEIAHSQSKALGDGSPQLKAVKLSPFLRPKNGLVGNARAGSFHNHVVSKTSSDESRPTSVLVGSFEKRIWSFTKMRNTV